MPVVGQIQIKQSVVYTPEHQEAQRIGRLDQGAVHPGEQDKAEEERQAGVPARRRQTMTGLRHRSWLPDCHAKSGERCARNAYPLGL